MNYTTVQTILEDHAIYLMGRKELRELVAFVKGTQFDLTAFLRTERGKSARLEDFSSALQTIGRKVCVFVLYLCSFISVSACQMVTFSL
jgi:hypothetical protein